MSARGVRYYVRYKGSLVGYHEELFGCVDIGYRGKDGSGLDIELEIGSDAWYPSPKDDKPPSSIGSIDTAIARLSTSLDKSKHWIN